MPSWSRGSVGDELDIPAGVDGADHEAQEVDVEVACFLHPVGADVG
jgi:hypothetical protein